MRLHGWGDADVLALLSLFRKYLLYYVYTSDNEFVEVVRAELPEKRAVEILEMVRALMHQFALGLSTKNFRKDVVVANGQEVYVYKHIYESIRALSENKVGGLWLPDELRRLLQKARQYRDLFSKNEDVYFKRIQVWSKSVAETKSKFYAFRSIYAREKQLRVYQRKRVESVRLELLETIFGDVSTAHQNEATAASNKALGLWSSEDMEMLVDLVVRITNEIQQTGRSDVINYIAETLHRTDASCMHKLVDMKEKFLGKLTTVRAASLPAIVFDPTSEAHKVFSANWSDLDDPYAVGYLALRRRSHKLTAERSKRRRSNSAYVPVAKLRSTAPVADRTPTSFRLNATDALAQGMSPLKTSSSLVGAHHAANAACTSEPCTKETAAVSRPPLVGTAPAKGALSVNDGTSFVQDIAEQCQWKKNVVHHMLRCMQQYLGLYRSNRLVAFYSTIASQTPGVAFQDVFVYGQFILTRFEQRFGSLDGFENLVPGTHSSTSIEHAPVIDESERDPGLVPRASPAQRVPQRGNENEAVKEGKRGHVHEQPSPVESPARTPQTGDEDIADAQSLSTVGKQSSPEGTWDERDDGYSDGDNGGLDHTSVHSLDAAAGNGDEAKSSHDNAENDLCMSKPFAAPRRHICDSLGKSPRQGKDEQHGKSSAKRRRSCEKNVVVSDDDGSNDESDEDDESSDDACNDARDKDDTDDKLFADADCLYSNEENLETAHPLRSILDSLGSDIAGLQDKQRVLIEQKEGREWHQREHESPVFDYAAPNVSEQQTGICDEQVALSRYESSCVRRRC